MIFDKLEELIERARVKKIEKINERLNKIARRELEKSLKQSSSKKHFASSKKSFVPPLFSSFSSTKNFEVRSSSVGKSPNNALPHGNVFCNRFLSRLAWFSARSTASSYGTVWNALKAHIRYVADKSRGDLELAEGLELDRWKVICDEETAKRWDARVAGKFFLTLPNSLSAEQALEIVKSFVENEIGSSHVGVAIHRNKGIIEGKDNLHAHVVFSARKKDGKKVRLVKEDLRRLQQKWDEYLKRAGYQIETAVWRKRKRVDLWLSGRVNERAIAYVKRQRRVWQLVKEAVDVERTYKQEGEKRRKDREREREREQLVKRGERERVTKDLRDFLKNYLEERLREERLREERKQREEWLRNYKVRIRPS